MWSAVQVSKATKFCVLGLPKPVSIEIYWNGCNVFFQRYFHQTIHEVLSLETFLLNRYNVTPSLAIWTMLQ